MPSISSTNFPSVHRPQSGEPLRYFLLYEQYKGYMETKTAGQPHLILDTVTTTLLATLASKHAMISDRLEARTMLQREIAQACRRDINTCLVRCVILYWVPDHGCNGSSANLNNDGAGLPVVRGAWLQKDGGITRKHRCDRETFTEQPKVGSGAGVVANFVHVLPEPAQRVERGSAHLPFFFRANEVLLSYPHAKATDWNPDLSKTSPATRNVWPQQLRKISTLSHQLPGQALDLKYIRSTVKTCAFHPRRDSRSSTT
nr:hypothetical protein CFP56_04587 [Quercus suber]